MHPSFINYSLKRRHFIARYVQLIIHDNCLKRISAIKIELQTIFITNGNHHMPTTNQHFFTMSKDNWDTKECTGKSMKNALYAQWYGERHLTTSNSEKNLSCSLTHCRVGGRQASRQAVNIYFFNSVGKRFMQIDLKAYLTNGAPSSSRGEFTLWFAHIPFFVPSMNHYFGFWCFPLSKNRPFLHIA